MAIITYRTANVQKHKNKKKTLNLRGVFVKSVVETTCPFCGAKRNTTVYPVVNTQENPGVAKKVQNGGLFKRSCHECGEEYLMPYPMMYHDVEHNKILCFASDLQDKITFEEDIQLRNSVAGGRFKIDTRIVDSNNKMVEKSRIFAAGYDDRVVEIIKVWALENLREQGHQYYVSEILCWVSENGELSIDFLGEKECSLITSKEGYHAAAEVLMPIIGDRCDETNVNFDWAMNIVAENDL